MRLAPTAIAILLTLGGPGRGQDPWDAFAAFYRDAVNRLGIVGSGILVLSGGEVVREEYAGFRDLAAKAPVDAATGFHWASITKTFTAVACLRLRDEGRLSLDDPAVRRVPELREVHCPSGPIESVTLRHLLSHSSGLRGRTWPWGDGQPWHPFEPPRWEQLAAMMPYTDVAFAPGSRYLYSNPGIVLLGKTLERLTNEDYETHIEKNVLRPLGMTRSYFDRAPWHLRGDRSRSWQRTGGALKELPFDFDTGVTVSNGGLNAPLRDLAKWLDFLAGNPERKEIHEGLLRRATLEEMFRPVVPVDVAQPAAGQVGLGFFLERHAGLDLVAHSGGQNGFVSHFYVHVPTRTALLLAFNTLAEAAPGEGPRSTAGLDHALRDRFWSEVHPSLRPR